jgi:hypothetical protein
MTWGSRAGSGNKVKGVLVLRANVLINKINSDGVIKGEIQTL